MSDRFHRLRVEFGFPRRGKGVSLPPGFDATALMVFPQHHLLATFVIYSFVYIELRRMQRIPFRRGNTYTVGELLLASDAICDQLSKIGISVEQIASERFLDLFVKTSLYIYTQACTRSYASGKEDERDGNVNEFQNQDELFNRVFLAASSPNVTPTTVVCLLCSQKYPHRQNHFI